MRIGDDIMYNFYELITSDNCKILKEFIFSVSVSILLTYLFSYNYYLISHYLEKANISNDTTFFLLDFNLNIKFTIAITFIEMSIIYVIFDFLKN